MACTASYQMISIKSENLSPDEKNKGRRGRKRSSRNASLEQDPSLRVPEPGHKRVRGRPRGHPTPLSNTEKRLRNAQYERERRIDMADAMTNLGNVFFEIKGDLGFTPNNAQLLDLVVEYIKEANDSPKEDIDSLARINQELEAQIAEAELRLGYSDSEKPGPSWR